MTDTPFTSFAIVGAGPHIGIPIVKAFLAIERPILVIARPTSDISILPTDDSNLRVVRADYTSVSEVAKILEAHKIDVLISGVSFVTGGVDVQNVLAGAAQAAGVKLFVPSEYGMPSTSEQGLTGTKARSASYLKSIGLPSLRIYNGMFHEFIPWLVCLDETGKFNIVGKGQDSVSFTSIKDVADYIAHVLTTQPPSRLLDVELRIEGQRISLSEIGKMYKDKVPVIYTDTLPTEGVSHVGVRQQLHLNFVNGGGSCGYDGVQDDEELAKSGNALWEGHQWLSIQEVLGL
ncbi:hypothetical protein F5I97DRAFT_2065851 [Phlebopus sp. FC_14]|nr:hypothetical protein F5I97DRAFT_2065851 [Phlebopus sp. FC_14]